MILFKTHEQQTADRQAELQKWEHTREPVFAWWPVQLEDGRVAWLENVFKDYGVERITDTLYFGGTRYYMSQK